MVIDRRDLRLASRVVEPRTLEAPMYAHVEIRTSRYDSAEDESQDHWVRVDRIASIIIAGVTGTFGGIAS